VLYVNLGSPYRRELQDNPPESEKDALTWPGEDDFYQLMKSPEGGRQPYYPTAPKLVSSNCVAEKIALVVTSVELRDIQAHFSKPPV